jgi:hypothetical protein
VNQLPIVKPCLDKARTDLSDATYQLGLSESEDTSVLAIEALGRAIASVSLAVERLAELVVES